MCQALSNWSGNELGGCYSRSLTVMRVREKVVWQEEAKQAAAEEESGEHLCNLSAYNWRPSWARSPNQAVSRVEIYHMCRSITTEIYHNYSTINAEISHFSLFNLIMSFSGCIWNWQSSSNQSLISSPFLLWLHDTNTYPSMEAYKM